MVKCVRLLSGEDLIADVIADIPGVFTLEDPAVIIMQPTPDGKSVNLMLLPYCPYITTPITVKSEHIVFTGEPSENLGNHYRAQFGSNLVIANSIPPSLIK